MGKRFAEYAKHIYFTSFRDPMNHPQYSVVIPAYCSPATLPELCEAIKNFFVANRNTFEIVIVNDNSPDNTWEVIKELKRNFSYPVKGINLSKNTGQHHALLCGFHYVSGQFIITIDDDLQFHPEEISKLIETQQTTNSDLVYGIQEVKQHSFIRNFGSKVVAYIFSNFASTPGRGSSFRLIRADLVEKIKHFNQKYIFLDELLAWFSNSTHFVTVNHRRRKEGKSGYTLFKLIVWTLRLIFLYTTLPLKVITYFGLIAFLVCLGFIGYFLYMKFTYGAELGFTALIVTILMSTGLVLFSIGVIGEYINRLFQLQTRRPVFFIKEII
ncbi:MAG: glycosyltransferase family 2 protein [Chitinophagales bacterium]|nr:glycosyltransferase family 2 protein [Chitinophagales bacterium]